LLRQGARPSFTHEDSHWEPPLARRLDAAFEVAGLVEVGHHGLLDQDVAAAIQRLDALAVVERVGRGDDDGVGLGLLVEPVEVGERGGWFGRLAQRPTDQPIDARGVGIVEACDVGFGDDFELACVFLLDVAAPDEREADGRGRGLAVGRVGGGHGGAPWAGG